MVAEAVAIVVATVVAIVAETATTEEVVTKPADTADGEMITQEDTIFIQGMTPETTEEEIAERFGSIGVIKRDKRTQKPKIWMYKDKETGNMKGEATVTYDDASAAQSAIGWFDNKEFNGAIVKVTLAQRFSNWQNKGGNRGGFNKGGGGGGGYGGGGNRMGGGDRGGSSAGGGGDRGGFNRGGGDRDDSRSRPPPGGAMGGARGGFGGGGGGGGSGGAQDREGDWNCGECNNKNFAWRNECNRCKAPKGDGAGSGSDGGSRGGYGGGGGNRNGGGAGGGRDRGSFGGGRGGGAGGQDRGYGGANRGGRDNGGSGGGYGGGAMRGNDRNNRNDQRQRPY
ncbi:RNA-binding protein cabeza-like isoform X5 [Anopheles funestus]|uniref:RNA-binding protein cabeza-like isoform X5 n=1 Tax=Anopheles funestus TaxID=62324 RepID=UPI0020C6EF0C|nr:RNA-binding protein cabeza-like isoform X5 [Anopheles funestus]XP_049301175.1 RNA-binding protein cabeza-like isoform X5 [Anopheles funestus]